MKPMQDKETKAPFASPTTKDVGKAHAMRSASLISALTVFLLGAAWPATVAAEDGKEEPSAQAAPKEEPLDVDAILANPLAEEDYRDSSNCLRLRAIDEVEILDDTMVVFHGRRRERWLNKLSTQCLGLEADMIVDLKSYAGSICRLDRFTGRPPFAGLGAIYADCRLGAFESVDEAQLEALRVAVDERRRVADMARKTKNKAK